jgi:hypothetical protein
MRWENWDLRWPRETHSLGDPILKITRAKWSGGAVHAVQRLLCKWEALSANLSCTMHVIFKKTITILILMEKFLKKTHKEESIDLRSYSYLSFWYLWKCVLEMNLALNFFFLFNVWKWFIYTSEIWSVGCRMPYHQAKPMRRPKSKQTNHFWSHSCSPAVLWLFWEQKFKQNRYMINLPYHLESIYTVQTVLITCASLDTALSLMEALCWICTAVTFTWGL